MKTIPASTSVAIFCLFLAACNSGSSALSSSNTEAPLLVYYANNNGAGYIAGNLGGVSGADALCMSDPASAALPNGKQAKAAIVDGVSRVACTSANCTSGGNSENIDWAFQPATTYKNIQESIVGTTTPAAIFIAPLQNAFSIDGGSYAFSGLNPDWTYSGQSCDSWTNTAVADYTSPYITGLTNVTDSAAWANPFYDPITIGVSCSDASAIQTVVIPIPVGLLCVQQP